MKTTFNKYWILISVIIIMNILVFIILSNKLESYAVDKMIEEQGINVIL